MSMSDSRGFTLIELVMAMAVFSFMLLVVLAGFDNIIQLHNGAVEANAAQDNATGAINALVSDVRASSQVVTPAPGPSLPSSASSLCLLTASGGWEYFQVVTNTLVSPNTKILYMSDNCSNIASNAVALTSADVQVANFQATVETGGPSAPEQEVQVTITVASNNNSTFGSGAATKCDNDEQDREFCSVVTLTSGAVPR
jgi:prepilin-type N-terminal cleavage/methylation domain-containing protein